MLEDEDVRTHLMKFYDAVDKLNAINIEINGDLLTIILLYSLRSSFENFRCAIETRDTLPDAESLKVKIIEEYESWKQKARENESNAMFLKQSNGKPVNMNKTNAKLLSGSSGSHIKYKCRKCNKVGHKAADCYSKNKVISNPETGVTNQTLKNKNLNQLFKQIIMATFKGGAWILDALPICATKRKCFQTLKRHRTESN